MDVEKKPRILPEFPVVLVEEMEQAVGQAIGAASVCWEDMSGTGVFQEQRARQIVGELMDIIVQFTRQEATRHNKDQDVLVNTEDVMHKVWRGLDQAGLSEQQVIDATMCMQNEGVYFREANS